MKGYFLINKALPPIIITAKSKDHQGLKYDLQTSCPKQVKAANKGFVSERIRETGQLFLTVSIPVIIGLIIFSSIGIVVEVLNEGTGRLPPRFVSAPATFPGTVVVVGEGIVVAVV